MNARARAALVAATMTAAVLSWTAGTAQACTVPDFAHNRAVTVAGPCSGKQTSNPDSGGQGAYQSYEVTGHHGVVDRDGNPVIDPKTGKQRQAPTRGWVTRQGAPSAPTFNPGAVSK